MKQKHFMLAFLAMLLSFASPIFAQVAKTGGQDYATLAEAIENASAGGTVTLIADVNQDVNISKNLTIDGAGKQYTGTMTANQGLTVTVQNVNFVNAGFEKPKAQNSTTGIYNIKNCTFDGAGSYAYPIRMYGGDQINVESCTVKDYVYSFLYVVKAALNVSVKNVTVENCPNYAIYFASGVNNAKIEGLTVKNANNGLIIDNTSTRQLTIKDCKMETVNTAINHSKGTNAINVTVNGAIDFGGAAMSQYVNLAGGTAVVAKVGEVNYLSLADAVAAAPAGETVELVNDATGAGVVINKDITIDFAGNTYTFNKTVGSAGTTTLGLQILKDNNVTLKNGTLTSTAVVAGKEVKMLIQNYANLTLENMNLVDATDHILYALSNNCGETLLTGNTNITTDAVAFDSYKDNAYAAPTVTVETTGKIEGKIEKNDGATIAIKGGIFTVAIDPAWCAAGYVPVEIAENTYGVKADPTFGKVAKVGEELYETFAAAVAAAPAGSTITLVNDATESATVVLTKNLKIDGADKTFTGAIEFKNANGSFTVKNVKFNGAGNRVYALKSQANTTNLTVENCEATGYTYGFLYANKAIANVTVTDVTVENVTYGVHSAYGTNVTLNNFVANNVEYGVMVQNYGKRKVVLNNCSFTNSANPLYIWERNQTNKITFNFKGANEMGKADFCASAMAVVNADAVVGTKVCGTLAAAVEAAEAGDTVTLLRNAQLDSFVTINKSITLNMGEYNITRDGGTALYVNGDVEVVINGTTGTVTGSQALWVANGLAMVNGGNFCGVAEAVYVTNTGKAKIYGGTFSSSNYGNFVLNKKDDSRETTSITVYGGTFVGFNPADNAAEGKNTNFVATGLMAVDNGDGTYGIAKANIKMGDNYYATLAEAIAAIGSSDVVIELLADVTFDYNARDAYGTAETTSVTIKGNGKTLTLNQKNSDWASIGLANANGKLVLNDMTIEKTGYGDTSGAWNTHAIIFSCPVEMNNVTVNNGIAVQAGATLNNVTINEANGYYGLWVNGNGQSVTMNGGAINATNGGRGIKIADQYIDAPAQVTLNVTGTAFSTAKKAAVLVSSKAGANVTADSVNIENVDADKVNFVWVDEDWSPYFAEVKVTGATVAQEGEGFVAQRSNGASYKTLAAAITAATSGETITLIGDVKESVTIGKNINIDGKGRTITGTITLQGSNIVSTVKNVNFDGDNKALYYAFSVRNTMNLTITDCTVKNYFSGLFYAPKSSNNVTVKNVTVEDCGEYLAYMVSLNSATFEDVTIKNSESGILVTNSGPKKVTLKNCTMTDVDMPIEIKEKATANITVIFEGVNEMDKAEFYESQYVNVVAAAQVGTKVCGSLDTAFDAAQDGETVKMLGNVTLDTKGAMDICDRYPTFVCVEGKAITLDLNGKNITANAYAEDLTGTMLLGVFSTDNGGKLTLVDSEGTATVTLNANDAKVYSLLCNYEGGCQIKVEGGTYVVDKVSDSMLYSGADASENEGVIVNGGNFTLGNVGEGTNGKPWIFNVLGGNTGNVVVNGGTFNADVNHQFWALEVEIPATKALQNNGDATWTVVDAVASVKESFRDNKRTVGYATLADAVASTYGNEITLLADATGAGVVINKDITIDFAGKTYTFNKTVGSAGTTTLGLQILKDNNVTLKNGTLTSTAVVEGKEVKMLIQNYANLTLENMSLVDATDHILYALSNNCGETLLTGNTNIITDAVAFDSYKDNAYTAPTVNVETTGTIVGEIEKSVGATIAISGGTFTAEILPEWCAEYYAPVKNDDGTYGVVYTYVDELTIVDGQYTEFVNEIDKTVGKLTYKRIFPNVDTWYALYLPFEIELTDAFLNNYTIAYANDIHWVDANDDGIATTGEMSLEVIKINRGTLKANHPYLIKVKNEDAKEMKLELHDVVMHNTSEKHVVDFSSAYTKYCVSGTYVKASEATLGEGKECFIISGGSLRSMGTTATIAAFRIFITMENKDGSPVILDESAPIRIRIAGEEDQVTGIFTPYINNDVRGVKKGIFDLMGRPVVTPEKGKIYIIDGKKRLY